MLEELGGSDRARLAAAVPVVHRVKVRLVHGHLILHETAPAVVPVCPRTERRRGRARGGARGGARGRRCRRRLHPFRGLLRGSVAVPGRGGATASIAAPGGRGGGGGGAAAAAAAALRG